MFVTHFLKRVLPFALALLGGVSLWWLVSPAAQVFSDVLYLELGEARGGKAPVINTPRGDVGDVGPGRDIDYSPTSTASDVTRKAVLLSKPEPSYTAAAREQNITGVVRLRVVLGADGRVLTPK